MRLPGVPCCCHALPKLCLLHCCAFFTCFPLCLLILLLMFLLPLPLLQLMVPLLPLLPLLALPLLLSPCFSNNPCFPFCYLLFSASAAFTMKVFIKTNLASSLPQFPLPLNSLSLMRSSSHSLSLDCTGKVWYADASSLPAAQAHKCHLRAP